jgi:hypothetical protein
MFTRRAPLVLCAAAITLLGACSSDGPSEGELEFMMVPPSVNVAAGSSGGGTLVVTRSGGLSGSVDLAVASAPEGVSLDFAPATIPATGTSAAVRITTTSSVPAGTYQATIRASHGGVSVQHPMSVVVLPEGSTFFRLAPASTTLTAGSAAATTTIGIVRVAPFTGSVSFAAANVPQGLVATVTPAATSGNEVTLAVSSSGGLPAGSYPFDLRASASGSADALVRFTVEVGTPAVPPSTGTIGLAFSPQTLDLVAGGTTASVAMTLSRTNGFTGPVGYWVDYAPDGLDVTLDPPDALGAAQSSATVTLQASAAVVPGEYPVRIFAWGTDTGIPMTIGTLTVKVNGAP